MPVNEEHYQECPQHSDPTAPLCYCEGDGAAYFEEPPDMADRENGVFRPWRGHGE
ncbi:hypothetical protein ABZX40_13480 [Streptomyces sp. NPDC004610]|uniref:hypothetical protein n=1 Tax=unclassified Streptomyces TaxID=2593676 RepID=UPI0033B414AC